MTAPDLVPDDRPVVVCGAGAAGMAAAIAAARHGVPALLVESASRPGGTVAHALIHTLGGLYDSKGQLLSDGLTAELVERLCEADARVTKRRMGRLYVLSVDVRVYQETTQKWLESESKLTLLTESEVTKVVGSGHEVQHVEIETPDSKFTVSPRAVVDTTGIGSLVEKISPDALEDDAERAAGGLIVRLRDVLPGALEFPRGIGIVRGLRTAASRGELPPSCEHAWIDTGTFPDEVYLKLFVPLKAGWREPACRESIAAEAGRIAREVVDYLRGLPEFREATVSEAGELGIRDGGRIQGEYRLTAEDVRQGKTFSDGVCRCAWPIEYWHPEEGVQLEALPSDSTYEIPLRALRLKNWNNVFMAGKCLSADHLAQASARVAGACWAMGESVGGAAAGCDSTNRSGKQK